MGGGHFDDNAYVSSRSARVASGTPDFAYTQHATRIHETLDPKRILTKPFHLLESRDSVEHPESTPVILSFDVTGSNYQNAQVAQQKLPELMGKLGCCLSNPQVAVWSNDDTHSIGGNAIQLSDFESDNRIDEAIRNFWLTGQGGGNDGESYDLILYAAARKTVADSWDKRHKKGFLFLYADEPFFSQVSANDIRGVFGDPAEQNIPLANIIAEVKEKWHLQVIWPSNGYKHAREQYVTLFGADCVETLQDPNLLCDKVASMVQATIGNLHDQTMAAANNDEVYSTRVE